MADIRRGRLLVLGSLITVFALSTTVDLLGAGSTPLVRYGRPLAMALSCLLVWQRRPWARALVVLLGLGVLLAGPIGMANGLRPSTVGGALFWLMSLLTAVSFFILFGSRDSRAYVNSSAATDAPPPSGAAGA